MHNENLNKCGESQITFIIRTDNELYMNECMLYLSRLLVPDNFSVDIVQIKESVSILDALKESFSEINARYRIYIEEGTLITNISFISEMLDAISESDCQIIGFDINDDLTENKQNGMTYVSNKAIIFSGELDWNSISYDEGCVGIETSSLIGFDLDKYFDEISFEGDSYTWIINILLKRIEHDFPDNYYQELVDAIKSQQINNDYVLGRIDDICLNSFEVKNKLCTLINENISPLVSVIVPIYNAERFISQTIDSIVNQTYKNLEIILVDDCSTDNTIDILYRYEQLDPRIKVVTYEKNEHICYAGNEGYKQAHGKYIALCGHDDIWMNDKLEKQVEYLVNHKDVGACFTLTSIIDDLGKVYPHDGKVNDLYHTFDKDNRGRIEWLQLLMDYGNCFCAPSVLMQAGCIEDRLYSYPYVQLQDYLLWLNVLKKWDVHIIQERLTLYRHFDGDKNLSSMDNGKLNRMQHELNHIDYRFIMDLTDEEFVEIFSTRFMCKDSSSKKELLCERAMMLKAGNNPYSIDLFNHLLNDNEARILLERKYGFSLCHYYEFSKQSLNFDFGNNPLVDQYNRLQKENEELINIIRRYEDIVQKLTEHK